MCLRRLLKGLLCVGGIVLPGGSSSDWTVQWMMSKPPPPHPLHTSPHTHTHTHKSQHARAALHLMRRGYVGKKSKQKPAKEHAFTHLTSHRELSPPAPLLCRVPVWDLSSVEGAFVDLLCEDALMMRDLPPAVVWSAGRGRSLTDQRKTEREMPVRMSDWDPYCCLLQSSRSGYF